MEVVAALLGAQLVPVLRDLASDEGLDHSGPLVGRDFVVLLLSLLGLLLEFPRQVELFAVPEPLDRLGPDLLAFQRELGPYVLDADVSVALHGPEASVSGVALQEGGFVGGGKEDALSRVDLDLAAVCGAEAVLLLRDEGLVSLGGRLLVVGQLAELDEPLAAELLHALLALYAGEAVVEPVAAEDLDEGGLADALGAYEGEDVVVLASRSHHAGHGGGEVLAGHRPGEGVVLGAQVVEQEGVEPLHSVPAEALQPLAHRVERALAHGEVVRVQQGLLACELVVAADVVDEAVVVAVVPERIPLVSGPPWQLPADAVASSEGVTPDLVLEPRVVADDESEVVRRGKEVAAPLVHLQLLRPLEVRLRLALSALLCLRRLGKFVGQLLHAFPGSLSGGALVLAGVCLHGHEARDLVDRRGVEVGALVQIGEQVQADHVEGVAELAAARVGAVVGVRPGVLVCHHAAEGRAVLVGPAVLLCGLCVDSGQEGLDGLGDAVGAAEGADDARLGAWVLLLRSAADWVVHFVHGPLGHVAPVGIGGEECVGVSGFAFSCQSDELGVPGSRGPVHEAARLVGARVEQCEAYVVREPSRDRAVLVRCDLSAEGYDEAVARLLRAVAVGAVEAPGSAGEHVGHDVRGAGCTVVDVQRHEGASFDLCGLASRAPEGTAHEASDVLDAAPLGLGHGLVLGGRLSCALHLGELGAQLLPCYLPLLPLCLESRASCCY